MKRPPIFTIMLAIFALVIVLGICGMIGMFRLAVANVSWAGTFPGNGETWTPANFADGEVDFGPIMRGVSSAGLALAALLLGLATFFSRRISRPLVRLTRAANKMAAGDLSARVEDKSAMREIHDLSLAFNNMAADLSRADQQRRQLTADVAHELRTPLSIIRGRLEGMQDGVYQATPEQVEILLHEAALLERLIEDLRLLALADAGQLPLYRAAVDPARLLQDVAKGLETQAQAAAISLRVEAPNALPEVMADPQRITQVLANLAGNALRYTPAGGMVTLSVSLYPEVRDQSLVRFAVSDTGAGIPPEDLPNIFERFWRSDKSRTRSTGGSGLGLAIARRIVEAHGGQIWATSVVGQGTTVSFTLPVDE